MRPLKDKKKQREVDSYVHEVLKKRGMKWRDVYILIGDSLFISRHYYLR